MLLSIARVPSENSGQNVPPAVGEPVADRHGNIGAVIGRPAAPKELENLAPDTWYVNVLAVRPQFRGAGLGTRLLAHADDIASERGHRGLSIIVSDANRGARRLYERCGYEEAASRAMVKEAWVNEGQNWVLLMKTLG